MKYLKPTFFLLLYLTGSLQAVLAQDAAVPEMQGHWIFNEKLSDSTDKKVEAALKASGAKIKKTWFSRDKEKYRGGPAEQELYDRISYDRELTLAFDSDVYMFTYADDYRRPVYTDNRKRSVSLTGLDQVEDFSFAHWEKAALMVEARPRDGGFADETYRLINQGTQLEVKLYIKPHTFQVPIELTRIFDRQITP